LPGGDAEPDGQAVAQRAQVDRPRHAHEQPACCRVCGVCVGCGELHPAWRYGRIAAGGGKRTTQLRVPPANVTGVPVLHSRHHQHCHWHLADATTAPTPIPTPTPTPTCAEHHERVELALQQAGQHDREAAKQRDIVRGARHNAPVIVVCVDHRQRAGTQQHGPWSGNRATCARVVGPRTSERSRAGAWGRMARAGRLPSIPCLHLVPSPPLPHTWIVDAVGVGRARTPGHRRCGRSAAAARCHLAGGCCVVVYTRGVQSLKRAGRGHRCCIEFWGSDQRCPCNLNGPEGGGGVVVG
jgi:hypothetical protein